MRKWWLTRRAAQCKVTAIEAETRDDAKREVQRITGDAQFTTGVNAYQEAPADIVDYLETEFQMQRFTIPVEGDHQDMTYYRHKVPGGWVYLYRHQPDDNSAVLLPVFVPLPPVSYEEL